jgi:sulfur-oxidizing protein SoxX
MLKQQERQKMADKCNGRNCRMKVAFGILAAMSFALAGSALAEGVAPADVKIVDMKVETPVTPVAGNAEEGAKTFKDGKLGNCLACHANKAMVKDLFHGNVGPELNGVATRYVPAQLRAIIINAKAVFGEKSMMPGFYSLEVGKNVREEFVGKTVLTAQQVEDVLAYITTLKD